MRITSRFSAKTALAITLFWVAALALTGATDALLFLAPALLIAIPLLGGHYLGEELIVKLASRRSPRPRHAKPVSVRQLPSTLAVWRPRGATLIAFSLAERPPPARLLTQN